MMRPLLIAAMALAVFSCKKNELEPGSYKIRYVVEGDGIEEIKYNVNNINYNVKGNFRDGWDTTFIHSTKQKLELQAKAKSTTATSLIGTIYVNDVVASKETDAAKDSDSKFEIKIEHQMP